MEGFDPDTPLFVASGIFAGGAFLCVPSAKLLSI